MKSNKVIVLEKYYQNNSSIVQEIYKVNNNEELLYLINFKYLDLKSIILSNKKYIKEYKNKYILDLLQRYFWQYDIIFENGSIVSIDFQKIEIAEKFKREAYCLDISLEKHIAHINSIKNIDICKNIYKNKMLDVI